MVSALQTPFALRTVSGVKQSLPQHPGYGQQRFLMEMCDPETKGGLFCHENQWQHKLPMCLHLHTRWDSCVPWKNRSCYYNNLFHIHYLFQTAHSIWGQSSICSFIYLFAHSFTHSIIYSTSFRHSSFIHTSYMGAEVVDCFKRN